MGVILQLVENIKPSKTIVVHFPLKFQENQRTKNRSLSFTHFTSLTHTHFFISQFTWGSRTSYLANDDESRWLFRGEGFGRELARLGQGGSSAGRARLAQGGFRGQFYKRCPFKRNFWKPQNFAQKFM